MIPARHAAKAEHMERSLQKVSAADYEAVIEGCMLAGTHWFNIALHKLGITQPADDALHAEFLTAGVRSKLNLVMPEILNALDEIENFRSLFVRGDAAHGEAAGRRCLELLESLRRAADEAEPYWTRL